MSASPNPNPASHDPMGFALPPTRQERRVKAAQLLEAVIDERIEPRIAINHWPEGQELPDSSLDCAYLALWHFESDETQQKTEMFYMDAQLELLRQIADHLKVGRDLPPYILRTYLPATPVRFYYHRSVWEASKHFITSVWTHARATWQLALTLLQPR